MQSTVAPGSGGLVSGASPGAPGFLGSQPQAALMKQMLMDQRAQLMEQQKQQFLREQRQHQQQQQQQQILAEQVTCPHGVTHSFVHAFIWHLLSVCDRVTVCVLCCFHSQSSISWESWDHLWNGDLTINWTFSCKELGYSSKTALHHHLQGPFARHFFNSHLPRLLILDTGATL